MQDSYPDNPVVVRFERGGEIESVHRGAWCLVDDSGEVLEGAGAFESPFYVRSAIKSLQALPLVETGAAERFGFRDEDLVLALSSHSGEACHTESVAGTLSRLDLGEADLRCGTHPPNDPATRAALKAAGEAPTQLHNNCSGKHAGFLALARHLSVPTERYLDPESEVQVLAREALAAMTDTPASALVPGIDGCSAPTYRVPLRGVATAFARVTHPDALGSERRAACERMTQAVAAHPALLAGNHKRIDTDLVRASEGRLFPKVGAEAIYAVGVRGAHRALALKIDDGAWRAMHALVVDLLARFELVGAAELEALAAWRDPVLRNHAKLDVGRIVARVID